MSNAFSTHRSSVLSPPSPARSDSMLTLRSIQGSVGLLRPRDTATTATAAFATATAARDTQHNRATAPRPVLCPATGCLNAILLPN